MTNLSKQNKAHEIILTSESYSVAFRRMQEEAILGDIDADYFWSRFGQYCGDNL